MDLKISELTPLTKTDMKITADKPISEEFGFILKRLGDEGLSERIGQLVTDIAEQGDKIAKRMDIREMRVYRALISEFINEIVTHSYKFTRENIINRRGQHKPYCMVRLINKELDDLAQELLKDEKNHIAILEKTGQIQGMILDMLV